MFIPKAPVMDLSFHYVLKVLDQEKGEDNKGLTESDLIHGAIIYLPKSQTHFVASTDSYEPHTFM